MKVALVGHGKMGRVVEELAAQRGVEVVARFTRCRPLGANDADGPDHASGCGAAGDPGHTALAAASGAAAGERPVLIDFSIPEAVLATVRAAARRRCNLVIGTTGWQDQLDAVRRTALDAGIGVVWGANLSLGVNVFYRVVERAAELLAGVAGYDPFIHDWHHRFKQDSPSGTALEIRRRMARVYGEREVPIGCTRAGYIPSAHSVTFDSAADTLHFEHRARNREGLAAGALLAAEWIAGRSGFHAFPDLLDDLLPALAAPAGSGPTHP